MKILENFKLKCCCCQEKLNYIRLLFWFAIFPTIGSLLYVYLSSVTFYNYWEIIYTLNSIFFIDCTWFCLLCSIGFFLLHFKIINKILATLYTIALSSVIICCTVCILMSQFTHATLLADDKDNFIINSIKQYFIDNEDIPNWMHQIQYEKKCCGFSGPNDWKEFIYPPDKPGVEDVPLSCCIVNVIGCNLIIGELSKIYGSNNMTLVVSKHLSKWIYVNGCRKFIQLLLDSILCYVTYGSIVLIVVAILILSLYWWEFMELIKEDALVDELLLDLERRGSCTSRSSISSRCSSRSNPNKSNNKSRTPKRKRSIAMFQDDDDDEDNVGDIVLADNISEYSGHRSPN